MGWLAGPSGGLACKVLTESAWERPSLAWILALVVGWSWN